jgi:hypothetical protein
LDGKDGRDGKDGVDGKSIDEEELEERIRKRVKSIRFYGPAGTGPAGVGVPAGGTTNQVLRKKSATDYDTEWVTGGTGGVVWGAITGLLSDQTDLKSVLDAKADITSLSGVATSGAYNSLTGLPALKAVATSGVYADLTGKPTLGTVASTFASTWAFSVHEHDAASVTSGIFPLVRGGTNASTAVDARTQLGLGTAATTNASIYASSTHRHDASHTTSGVFDTARLASSGTANVTTVLYGDQTWRGLPAGGSGTVTSVAVSTTIAGVAVSGSPITTAGTIVLATSGIFASASLASSGTADATTFLRGDRTWASPGAGSFSVNQTTVALPFVSRSHSVVVTAASVNSSSKILLSLAGVPETEANSYDMVELLGMQAVASTGAFTFQANFLTPIGGNLKINYAVG